MITAAGRPMIVSNGRKRTWNCYPPRKTPLLLRLIAVWAKAFGKSALDTTKHFLILVFIAVIGTRIAQAADGWQDAKWGAPEDAVKSAYPSATRTRPDDDKQKSPAGQKCLLRMPYAAGDRKFDVRFCFDGKLHLMSVILTLQLPMNSRALSHDLSEKYGNPTTDNTPLGVTDSHWRDGDTLIELFSIADPSVILQANAPYKDSFATLTYTAANNFSNTGL